MLTWDEARSCVLARTPVLSRERVRLEEAAGRFLAEPIIARNDSPPFAASAVDGFAVHCQDVTGASKSRPVRLRILSTMRAGEASTTCLRSGTAVKIMTGACVPPAAKAVVMKEHCREESGTVVVHQPVRLGENIRPRGGEFRKGRKVLASGIAVTPPVVGLLATFGYTRILVHKRPVVTIVATGDELLAPAQALRPGKIRDANSFALAAAVRSLGIELCHAQRLKDRPAVLRRRLSAALSESDVLLVAGGVSVGDHDHVRAVLTECGVEEQFWRMAVKPGKPAYFGLLERNTRERAKGARHRSRQSSLVFGLPGNPVSALVCFHQLVKPALLRMMGFSTKPSLTLPARLVGERRKQPGRIEWLRGMLSSEDGSVTVVPLSGQDSHMLGGLAGANCLIGFPEQAGALADGEQVLVELLSWHT